MADHRKNSQQLIAELARCFDIREPAIAVLSALDIEPGSLRPFNSMATIDWWGELWNKLENGSFGKIGVPNLLAAAAVRSPGNDLFRPFADPAADPTRALPGINVQFVVEDDVEDQVLQEFVSAVVKAARLAKKVKAYCVIGEKGSSKMELRVEGLDPEQVDQLRDAIRDLARARRLRTDVSALPYTHQNYYMDPLQAVGPDGRRFALDHVLASTPVKDIARGVMHEYVSDLGDKVKPDAPEHAVVDHVTDGGTVRLNPTQTLHEAGVRPGSTLMVAPERTAGGLDPRRREEALTRARLKVLAHAAANPGFDVQANSLVAPTEYLLSFRVPGFGRPPGPGAQPRLVDEHRVLIELPADFPVKAPLAWWQTEIFHPNIEPKSGGVCLGELQQYYRPDLDFGDLCKMLVDIAAYRTYTIDPYQFLDAEARSWAVSEAGQRAIVARGGSPIGIPDGKQHAPPSFRIRRLDG